MAAGRELASVPNQDWAEMADAERAGDWLRFSLVVLRHWRAYDGLTALDRGRLDVAAAAAAARVLPPAPLAASG